LATRLGAAATEHLARGEQGLMVGVVRGEVAAIPLSEVVANKKALDLKLVELAEVLVK
ncbi:MAG: pfk-3, partial [Rubrobacteraceae bacterium]|nr:pfk-3 [Rubrobacteraceae bacterium]